MDKIKFANLLEKWNPRNKKKHEESKYSVRSIEISFPTVDSNKQKIHNYYNEEENMEHLIRLVERKIDLTEENGESKRGSPWFIDNKTRHTTKVLVARGDTEKRSFMSTSQKSSARRIYKRLKSKFLAGGGKLSDKPPHGPAETQDEKLHATSVMLALDGLTGRSKKKSKKSMSKK